MKKLFILSILALGTLSATPSHSEELVRNIRLNAGGGFFDEGAYDEDTGMLSGEFEIGLREGNFTNSLGLGINYYDFDDTDADPTTFEIYYSPRYTFDNNWYVAGRVGYSFGDDTHSYGFFEDEVDMTGFVFGFESGYTFENNLSLHLGYKAVETEVTVKNRYSGRKYSEDGYTHLGYLGIGYSF